MEKKRISNSTIISIVIIGLISLIGIKVGIEFKQNHEDRLMKAFTGKIEYQSLRCYYEDNCGEEFTLKDLIDKKYLGEQVNPVTKEVIRTDVKIKISDSKKVTIYW